MTGAFTEADPQRCGHYARFMQNVPLAQAEAAFWLLFCGVLALMCISAIQHHKSTQLTEQEKNELGPENGTSGHQNSIYEKRRRYFAIASLCFVLSILCVVLECFTLFNIEYCDGEDLMQLYWGIWSVMQVGSLIAIGGVMLQLWIVMANVDMPSWAVALGTPVLVFAALGWVFRFAGKRVWSSFSGRKYDESDDEGEDLESGEKYGMGYWISRA